MKKIATSKKLSLSTETISKLQSDDLHGVQGGATPAVVFTASVRFCVAIGNLALGSAQRSCVTCRCR